MTLRPNLFFVRRVDGRMLGSVQLSDTGLQCEASGAGGCSSRDRHRADQLGL